MCKTQRSPQPLSRRPTLASWAVFCVMVAASASMSRLAFVLIAWGASMVTVQICWASPSWQWATVRAKLAADCIRDLDSATILGAVALDYSTPSC